LAEEVGRSLGTVAALATLRRTSFGPFSIVSAHPLEALLALAPEEPLPVVDVRAALRPAREIPVGRELAWAIAAGQQAALRQLDGPMPGEQIAAVIAPGGEVLAVLGAAPGGWALERVLMPEASQLYRA
jgi:tRNA U55 pseudouridine synthase TruB